MDALLALDRPASVEEVRERLTDPPSYSAVRAMLAKLETKGHIRHREHGLRYVYAPTASRSTAQRSALKRLVDVFFAGSPGKTATALLQQESWSQEELDELAAMIKQIRKEGSTKR